MENRYIYNNKKEKLLPFMDNKKTPFLFISPEELEKEKNIMAGRINKPALYVPIKKRFKIKKKKEWHHSEKTKRKLSLIMKTLYQGNEIKDKISRANKGRKLSPETCKRISNAKSGERHPQWRGGISNKPHGLDFNKKLKFEIRSRDEFICMICSMSENGRHHPVHHIDYCKMNNDPKNLITLCPNCHSLTNHNREEWAAYFMASFGQDAIKNLCI